MFRAAIYCVTKWSLPRPPSILKTCSGGSSYPISSRLVVEYIIQRTDCCRHSFKENSDDISRINLDSNPLFHQINSNVVVAVINFIYTGWHSSYNFL